MPDKIINDRKIMARYICKFFSLVRLRAFRIDIIILLSIFPKGFVRITINGGKREIVRNSEAEVIIINTIVLKSHTLFFLFR